MSFLGKTHSKENKEKNRLAHLGKKASEETKKKMGLAHKGFKHSAESIEKMRLACKGRVPPRPSEEEKEKQRIRMKGNKYGLGYKYSEKQKATMSLKRRGKSHYNWQGGISPVTKRIRESANYVKWRSSVFLRDNFTCQNCNEHGIRLVAHHCNIAFSKLVNTFKKQFPLVDLYEGILEYIPMWDKRNGISLCEKCHKKLHRKKAG